MTWTAQSLTQLATGYWPAATLTAGVELGLFDALDAGPAGVETLARRTEAEPARLVDLLDALVAIDLLIKAGGLYDFAPDARTLLARSSPTCMLDALAYNGHLYRQWAHLPSVVRGENLPAGRSQLGGDPAATRRFVLGMDAKARAFVLAIAACLDLEGATTLLDIGAGPGTLSRVLAEWSPGLRVTLLDLPEVLAVAKEVCATSPVCGRLAFHAADYRSDPLPASFDAIVYAGALHQETAASAALLFSKFRNALRPGGRVFVIDLMLEQGRTTPQFSALFQLNMLLLRPGSRVFTIDETRNALEAAGFRPGQNVAVPQTPYRIIEGYVSAE